NVYFSKTNRRMVDEAAMHARRMNEYEFKHGRKVVEEFLDAVLSIEEHIDPNLFIRKDSARPDDQSKDEKGRRREGRYDDLFAEPELKGDGDAKTEKRSGPLEPRLPEKDLLYFLMKHSPVLDDWQRDVIAMIHDEMAYFVPQMQTKIMNEGWASIWHSR